MLKPANLPDPEFDRYDICCAYLALEWDWHQGGVLWERRSCERKRRSVGVQLHNMGFRTPAGFEGYESLSDNGKAIYHAACDRLGLHNLREMKKFLENLGDASPLDYGGFFVYSQDLGSEFLGTARVGACVEYWDEPTDTGEERDVYRVYRFDLECFKMARLDDSLYMVPTQYQEDWPHSITAYRPWFVTGDGLTGVCESFEADPQEVEEDLCSADPVARAQVYRMIGEYHGFENLDSYPEEFSRKEMEVRYADELAELSARRCGRGKA